MQSGDTWTLYHKEKSREHKPYYFKQQAEITT